MLETLRFMAPGTQPSMELFEAVFQPLSLADFRQHFDEGKCLVVEGAANKFDGLVTPEDIERRLNDGCNANQFVQVIKDGARSANLMSNCAWSPAALNKSAVTQDLQDGYSFMMPNSSQITPGIARLCTELEAFFTDQAMHADVHLYVSTSDSGNSYNAHRDLPQHKILLQSHGDAVWQIFEPKKDIPNHVRAMTPEQEQEYLTIASEFTLKQGSLLYMPPGTFHRVVRVTGPRISISIPFYALQSAQKMDRSRIPFVELFAKMKTHTGN